MNWLLIFLAVILVWRIAEGIHRGMVKEILAFLSMIVLALGIGLISKAIGDYFMKDFLSMMVALLMLLILFVVHRIVAMFVTPMKLAAKLEGIKAVDKILGAVLGIAETIVITWALFCMVTNLNLGMFGTIIKEYVDQSAILTFVQANNVIAYLSSLIMGGIKVNK